jgi:hypothetical protein
VPTEVSWDGLACVPDNIGIMAYLEGWAIDVPLASTPGILTTVALDATVRLVELYAPDQSVRYALDAIPVATLQAQSTTVAWAEFRLGFTLPANTWRRTSVPNTFAPHSLNFLSPGGGMVTIIAYVENV